MSNNTVFDGFGIHHIALRTTDLERSLKFYGEGLGGNVVARWGDTEKQIAMIDMGDGTVLELFSSGVAADPVDEMKAGQWFHLAMRTPSADKAFARAIEFGAREKIAPKDVLIQAKPNPMDVRIAFVYGPDNEVLEFFQTK